MNMKDFDIERMTEEDLNNAVDNFTELLENKIIKDALEESEDKEIILRAFVSERYIRRTNK